MSRPMRKGKGKSLETALNELGVVVDAADEIEEWVLSSEDERALVGLVQTLTTKLHRCLLDPSDLANVGSGSRASSASNDALSDSTISEAIATAYHRVAREWGDGTVPLLEVHEALRRNRPPVHISQPRFHQVLLSMERRWLIDLNVAQQPTAEQRRTGIVRPGRGVVCYVTERQ